MVVGQGYPAIPSRFKDPTASENNAWMPSSVPGVRAQPWSANYEDGACGVRDFDDDYDRDDPDIPYRPMRDRGNCSNIADNPLHPAVGDELVGVETVVETRRAKYVAISALSRDLLDTTGALHAFEVLTPRETMWSERFCRCWAKRLFASAPRARGTSSRNGVE